MPNRHHQGGHGLEETAAERSRKGSRLAASRIDSSANSSSPRESDLGGTNVAPPHMFGARGGGVHVLKILWRRKTRPNSIGSSIWVKQRCLGRNLEDMLLAAAKDLTFGQPRLLWYDFSNDSAAKEKTTPGRRNNCASVRHPRELDSPMPSVTRRGTFYV